MMGVGKSTLGKIVAKKLDLKFVDIDLNIEKKCSMKIKEIFENKGENFFRIEEQKQTLRYLKKKNKIIALGGGAFINNKIRKAVLKNSLSFWLDLNLRNINKRVKWNKKRPLLDEKNSEKIIKRLYYKRKNIYKLANYKINCDGLSKNAITEKIIYFYEKHKAQYKN